MAIASSSPFLGHSPCHFGKSASPQITHNSFCIFKVKALFWGSRKSVKPADKVLPLGDFTLPAADSQGHTGTCEKISISVVSSISAVSPEEWDSCSLDATGGPRQFNPFLSYGFLSSLEESGSAVEGTGWIPQHIIAKDEKNNILGVVPLYLKSHSYGEYVFDHSWANAYYSYGLSYYPKLQCSVPFTPVTGARILVRNTSHKDQVFDILVSAMKDLAVKVMPMLTTAGNRSDRGGNRTVLITGVSRGLGKALALELAKKGHCVIGCSRSQDKLNVLQAELASATNPPSDNKHFLMTVDVSLNSSVEEFARAVKEKKGAPDIIVNSAGTINRNNKLWEVPAEEFDSVMDTNIKGTANVLRHFIPLMLEKKQGVIVNISSGWGRSGAAQVAPYCASKWAIEGLTRSVAKELPPGMAAVALNPGVIYTEMLQSCFGNSASLYQTPESWAPKAAAVILNLTMADNGASLTV